MDFPESFTTNRLYIRSPMPGDGAERCRAVSESLASLEPWLHWVRQTPTPEKEEESVRRARVAFLERTDLQMLLFDRNDGQLVGGSGLHRIEWEIPKFEIGYWCRSCFEGRGYIVEAVRGIADFAREHLKARRLEILCDARNHRSARVAEKAGFSLEARLEDASRAPDGSLSDTLIYASISRPRKSS